MVSLYQGLESVTHLSPRVFFLIGALPLTALATLKPQAGLVAPQAVPASQPTAAVSSGLYKSKMLLMNLQNKFLSVF